MSNSLFITKTFKGGTRHAIDRWNLSKASQISNPQQREFISRKSIESISNLKSRNRMTSVTSVKSRTLLVAELPSSITH
ncbi:hypothetical protein QUA79_23980 [Microcoleus sp. F8-D1]